MVLKRWLTCVGGIIVRPKASEASALLLVVLLAEKRHGGVLCTLSCVGKEVRRRLCV